MSYFSSTRSRGKSAALGALIAVSSSSPASSAPQQNLPPTVVYGGITMQDSFYGYLAEEISSQNEGQTGIETYQPFSDLGDDIDDVYETFSDFVTSIINTQNPFCGLFPGVCANNIYAKIIQELADICADPFGIAAVELDVQGGSEFARFDVSNFNFVGNTPGRHEILVTLSDVGIVYNTELKFESGIPCLPFYTFEDTYKTTLAAGEDIGLDGLQMVYRVTVDYTGFTPVVSAELVNDPIDFDFTFTIEDVATTLDGDQFATDLLGGLNAVVPIENALVSYAREEVPDRLEEIFQAWWIPYVPHAGWNLDLNASAQNNSYNLNQINGAIDPVSYSTLDTNISGSHLNATFMQGHSSIIADSLETASEN